MTTRHNPDTHAVSVTAPTGELNPLELAVAQSRVIFYVARLNATQRFEFVSSNIETVIGHKGADVLADPAYWWRFMHPDDVPGFQQALRHLPAKLSATHEFRYQTAAGDEVWLRAELNLIDEQTRGDKNTHYSACLHDITADKLAQQQQHETEAEQRRLIQLLRDALDSLPNGFGLSDVNGNLVLCNRAFAEPYALDPEAMIGMTLAQRMRIFLTQMAQFDGIAVTNSPQDTERWASRLQRTLIEPVELELHTGAWKLVTNAPTSEGGRVMIRTDITQQKKAESALRESQQLLSAFFDHAPLAIHFKDTDGHYKLVNKQFIKWFDLTETQVVGKTMDKFLSADNTSVFTALDQEVLACEQPLRRELQIPFADGAAHPVAVVKFPVFDTGNQIMGIGTFVADISVHKKLESELRQSRAVLEDAIESLAEGFALFDANDRLVMCNEAYREFYLHNRDAIVPGVKWLDLIHSYGEHGRLLDPADHNKAWVKEITARRQQLRHTRVDAVETKRKDGRWFKATAQTTRQGGMVIVREDITERRQMEQDLRESESLVRQVLEACPVPITMNRIDDGVILYESPAAQALLKYEQSQVGHSVIQRWASAEERKIYLKRLQRTKAVDDLEIRYKKADGELFWCALSARLIEYRGEQVIVSHLYDLTERHATEAELARQRELLHQSEKLSALGELLASVAHELNNPLSVVTGQALLLQETNKDARIAERATKIGNAADRCARIVKTFLAMARQQPSESKAVDLNAIIEAAVEVMAYMLRSSGIDLGLDLAAELPPVTGDADQLSQVVINLMVNAHQALEEMQEAGHLTLSTSVDSWRKQVILRIADNGPGIPADIRSRIFEPFFTTKQVGEGTGVGLALCHRIVSSHNGTIEADNAAEHGAVFIVRLPVGEKPAAVLPEPESSADLTRRLTVLVIDDEVNNADLLAEILIDLGHTAQTAYSGKAALRKLAQQDFDAILSDLRMPGLDGPGLYQFLQQQRPELLARIAFITGDTLGAKAGDFLRSAKRPYIEKPITPQDVESLLFRLIHNDESDGPAGNR